MHCHLLLRGGLPFQLWKADGFCQGNGGWGRPGVGLEWNATWVDFFVVLLDHGLNEVDLLRVLFCPQVQTFLTNRKLLTCRA